MSFKKFINKFGVFWSKTFQRTFQRTCQRKNFSFRIRPQYYRYL